MQVQHGCHMSCSFLTSGTEFVLFLAMLEKFCLAHGLRQLTRDVKSGVRTLNFKSGTTMKSMEWRSETGRYVT